MGLVLASILVAVPFPVLAQDARLVADARCMVVYTVVGQQKEHEAVGMLGAVYFYGKVIGYGGQLQLEEELLRQIPRMGPDELRTESVRCGQEMVKQGEALSLIGSRIKSHAGEY
ncbi:hypothetical protein ACFODL_08685 [Phenylobacterium terrae]|uniref:Uncharacterized protein n=1 Tax=Phenylobacterium terrae TaxID=2665495 RepID=A0ABW4N719_9CAUL